MSLSPDTPEPVPSPQFLTTRWTLVVSAARRSQPDADRALEELCRSYWFPLYCYVRRRGHSREDAEDLVQSFFLRFLGKNYFDGLSSGKGKFRAFLLACLKHYLANEWDRAGRQKRGSHAALISLDLAAADTQYQAALAGQLGPDKLYDRTWAVALLERVLAQLRTEAAAEGKCVLFEGAKSFLSLESSAIPYGEAAAALEMSEAALRVAVHRLRRRYRELLREEVAQTLSDPAQLEEELRGLLAAFAPSA